MTLKQLYEAIRKSNYCDFLVCLEIKYPEYPEYANTRHLIEFITYDIEDDICVWENDWNEGEPDEDVLVTGVVPIDLLDIDVLGRYIV